MKKQNSERDSKKKLIKEKQSNLQKPKIDEKQLKTQTSIEEIKLLPPRYEVPGRSSGIVTKDIKAQDAGYRPE